ncbi:MAG: hypothetical protein AVDCRST_MAG93-7519 [uncultured Chloroflexia bacterium]|uniref:Uncharacterized protein n=1 Tax=uncultured Chloroflexia bacterium TaxID=1672391 RepID=A0A6J4MIG9_9CHLR|nr:MAG: hypothetical protein AVDCRST_MAG93-7519 [uncultured Chloroflexia bacterium]
MQILRDNLTVFVTNAAPHIALRQAIYIGTSQRLMLSPME